MRGVFYAGGWLRLKSLLLSTYLKYAWLQLHTNF